jgi:hypothetical protein
MAQSDWSRPLPRPLTIPGGMTPSTLAATRELLDTCPDGYRGETRLRTDAGTQVIERDDRP